MKFFKILFFLCMSFNWLNSQVSDDAIILLVSKDSVSFYVFNKAGVAEYTILESKQLSKKYVKYSKPFPEELKQPELESLSSLYSNDGSAYFLYPGGGILFKYLNGVFERIDESFAYRNQFSGHFFEYKKELYLLGGYGYWQSNSLLTRFNFELKNWELVPTSGQTPKLGINSGSFVLDGDILTVFDFTQRVDDLDVKNNSLYSLNLDKMIWTKGGLLNKMLFAENEKSFDLVVGFKKSLLQKNLTDSDLRIITPKDNLIKFFKAEGLHNINARTIIVGDNVVYPVLSASREYETLTVKNLNENIVFLSEESLSNDFNLLVNYFIYVGVFCVLLIALTFFKFRKEKFMFFLSENSLSGLNKTMLINKDELFILELISRSKGREIDNSYILSYFKSSTISLDASVKRKNKVIEELNRKGLEKFELVLIIKKSKKSDSRKVKYQLNPVLEI